MKQRIDGIKKELHSKGYKLTPQREATLTVLLEREQDHLSAEEVFFLVKEKSPEIGLATVYRTLELLSELKIVDKINFGDRKSTRLNSSHVATSYAVFCFIKKN